MFSILSDNKIQNYKIKSSTRSILLLSNMFVFSDWLMVMVTQSNCRPWLLSSESLQMPDLWFPIEPILKTTTTKVTFIFHFLMESTLCGSKETFSCSKDQKQKLHLLVINQVIMQSPWFRRHKVSRFRQFITSLVAGKLSICFMVR